MGQITCMQFEQETYLRELTAGNTYSILWKSLVSENLHIAIVFGSTGPLAASTLKKRKTDVYAVSLLKLRGWSSR